MLMIHLFGGLLSADGTETLLLLDHFLNLGDPDAVSLPEVIVATPSIKPQVCLAAAGVVTGLAVLTSPVFLGPIAREVLERPFLAAVWAALQPHSPHR
jgi:hypothetical protein